MAKRRQKNEFNTSYWLLVENRNVDRNAENVDRNAENVDIFSQSKVKESKVKESKVYTAQNEPVDLDICPFFEELWRLYPNQKGRNRITAEALQEINDIGKEKMIQAIKAYRLEVSDLDIKYIKRGYTFFNGDLKDYLNKLDVEADLIIADCNKVPVFTGV